MHSQCRQVALEANHKMLCLASPQGAKCKEDGFSFSIWEKCVFDEQHLIEYDKSGTMPKKYILSTGEELHFLTSFSYQLNVKVNIQINMKQ